MVPETYFTVNQELLLFLYSVGMGVLLGMVYDIFRALRQLFPHRFFIVFVEDCIFFMIYSVLLMCFAVMFSRSQVRFYYAVGNTIGFALYYFTIGRIVMRFICDIIKILRFVFGEIARLILKIVRKTASCFVKNAEIVRIDKKSEKSY